MSQERQQQKEIMTRWGLAKKKASVEGGRILREKYNQTKLHIIFNEFVK